MNGVDFMATFPYHWSARFRYAPPMPVEPQVRSHRWRQAPCLGTRTFQFMIQVKRRTASEGAAAPVLNAVE